MIVKELQIVCEWAGGKLINNPDSEVIIRGVSKDTRTLEAGNLYIPIIGEQFDGHNFIKNAAEKGASASLWQSSHEIPDVDIPLIIVDNCLEAFHALAMNYRLSLDVKVVAITGSNGKTTTKDMLASVLSKKYNTAFNKGNENNEIGVPLTLLNLSEDTEVAIVEMGTERFGEIIVLTTMAKPNVAIITNVGDSHLEELFTKENVALEKFDIVKGLPEDGIFLYNGDDEILRAEVKKHDIPQKILNYGFKDFNTYIIDNAQSTADGTDFTVNGVVYHLPILGSYQVYNAAACIGVSELFGINVAQIQEGFNHISKTGMRNEIIALNDFDILDDSYKSNPQNLMSALETLYTLDKHTKKIAVLGDMLGLGTDSDRLHKEIGEILDPEQLELVYFYGDNMKFAAETAVNVFGTSRVKHYTDKNDLFEDLKKDVIDSFVLVKGSRAMKMEDIIEMLKDFSDNKNN